MIFNPNKEIIPFHPNKHWYLTDKQCKDNTKFQMKLLRYALYHFSTPIPNDWDHVTLSLYKMDGTDIGDDSFNEIKFYYDHQGNQTYITFEVDTALIPAGKYYIQIIDSRYPENPLYSEPFCVKGYSPEFTLRWSNKCLKVGNVIYAPTKTAQQTFRKLHIDGITVVLSDTQTTEEVVQDETGNETPVSQTITQKYMFSAVFPFYIIEALTTLPLHSDVYLEAHNKWEKKMERIEVTSEPEDFGCAGKVTIKFETNRVFKTGCCDDSVTEKIDYNPFHYDDDNYSTT